MTFKGVTHIPKTEQEVFQNDREWEKDLPSKLHGDQIRLKQVVINLAKNALKFSTKGEIRIRAAYNQSDEMLLVSVTDKGAGITEQEKSRLFQAFGKLNEHAQSNPEGVGVGLAICKKIVQKSGGFIDVFSKGLNQGATFVFGMRMKMLDLDLTPLRNFYDF